MRTISYKLDDLKKVVIPIGYEGENNHTRVIIDAGEVFKQYPEAAVALTVQPPKGTMYPAIVTRDGDTVTWDVKDSDCASNGNGEAQFTFTNGTVVVKSVVTKIKVQRSLHTEGPAPDPILSWLDEAEEVLDDLAAMDNIAKTAEAGDIGKALSPKTVEDGVVTEWQYVEPGAGTEDYTDLENKPKIGGVELSGDKSLHDLGIAAESDIPDVSGKANLSVVAPAFDQATANDAGSLVTYTDGVVYVLPDGHTAGTTWANTSKTATNIAEQQRLLKNEIQGLEDDKYEKPSGGIPSTDMTQVVQDALADAESAYQKPSGGIPASDIADGVIPVVDNALSNSSENAVQNKVVKGALDGKAPVIINTATGNPAFFNDGVGLPIKSLLIPFTPIQQGTGDPSPENIRPILPWNGLKVFGGGKNLLNPAKYVFNTITSRDLTFEVQSDGSVKVTGTTESSDFGPTLSVRFKLHAGTYYGYKDDGNVYVAYRKSTSEEDGVTTGLVSPFTLDGSEWVYCNIYVKEAGTFNTVVHPQIARENTQTAYEEYHPITDTDISFPSPVYGGEHEAVSGKLMDGWKVETLDDANAWTQGAYISYSNHDFGDRRKGSSWIGLCSVFPIREGVASGTAFARWGGADEGNFIISPNGSGLTLEDVKTLSGQGKIVLAYPLATPTEQTLTGHQITALIGNNTIWSDTDGQMIVEYHADTKTYINNLIATAIASL